MNVAEELQVAPDASLTRRADRIIELTTPQTNWSWAVIGDLSEPPPKNEARVGLRLVLDIELIAGKLGVFVSNNPPSAVLGRERVVERFGRQQIVLEQREPLPTAFCIRSVDCGAASARIFGISAQALVKFDISDILHEALPAILSSSEHGALEVVAQALSRSLERRVSAQDIGALEISSSQLPLKYPALSAIFDDAIGQTVVAEAQRLIDLLETYRPEKLTANIGYFGPEYLRKYLRQNTVRVYHLVRLLHELGLNRGSILEIGTYMGSFSTVLQRLGYNVTAVDRYLAYDGALQGYTDYMRSLGVNVVETSRDDAQVIKDLGQYDAVISMAVVEHIPHTPRLFLEMLAAHVKPGGILALDTPNIARYWNRLALSNGQSIHQDIGVQFYSDPPYEGHHREYTADELVWMMEQVGCKEVEVRRFDYNLLQFEQLEQPHDKALLTMILDPTQTDTILAAGRI